MTKIDLKYKKIIANILFVICLIGLIFSSYQIVMWKIDSNKTNEQIKMLQEIIQTNVESNNSFMAEDILLSITKLAIDSINGIDDEQEDNNSNNDNVENDGSGSYNPYFDYMKLNYLYIDFSELKNINPSVSGWIKLNGTNINYPFVQAKDNKYYLTHSFDKSYNSAGWVFLDYRNKIKDDRHIILYAHGRVDTTMFGSLRNALSTNWFKNKDNHLLKISTESENSIWQVFSIYTIPTTSDYLTINFHSNADFLNFTTMLKNRSIHKFDTELTETDNIITLSTCYNKKEKLVLHAKLIKKEVR